MLSHFVFPDFSGDGIGVSTPLLLDHIAPNGAAWN
jgi:hypothetical protein